MRERERKRERERERESWSVGLVYFQTTFTSHYMVHIDFVTPTFSSFFDLFNLIFGVFLVECFDF